MLIRLILLVLLAGVPPGWSPERPVRQTPLRYAALGPEAPAILRVLIGEDRILRLQPGELAEALNREHVAAFILTEDLADSDDLKAAKAAGLPVVMLKRHTSVANILANITSLCELTGTRDVGQRWIADIQAGTGYFRREAATLARVRVLILTPEAYTPGQGALVTELIALAGGVNTAAEAGLPEALQIEDAQIRALTPEVVLLVGWTAESAAAFAANPVYRTVPAFAQQRVRQIAAMPGRDPARLVADVRLLFEILHPLAF